MWMLKVVEGFRINMWRVRPVKSFIIHYSDFSQVQRYMYTLACLIFQAHKDGVNFDLKFSFLPLLLKGKHFFTHFYAIVK